MTQTPGDPSSAPAAISKRAEARLGAKALATLFAVGGFLVLLTALLPRATPGSDLGLIAVFVVAMITAAVLFRTAKRFPFGALPWMLAWGTALVTVVAYSSGDAPSPLVFFYLWVFLYATYFFSLRIAVAEIVFASLSFAAVLWLRTPPAGGISWWVIGVAILLVAAGLVWIMRSRSEQLIGRLYAASRTDPLTALTNRRGFREQLDLELERGRRSGSPVALLAGDLDGFKRVNDNHGHHVGDEALKQVARLLEAEKRSIDTVARAGGEEFTLILPDTDGDGAFVAAERLREAVLEGFADAPIPITISFGIAIFPKHGETAASLLRAADDALYFAKESGRNRTAHHDAAAERPTRRSLVGQGIAGERYVALMLELAEAVDLRFSGTARHSETVGRYAEMMAQELGMPEQRVSRIRLAGMLHDIGKVALPAAILDKPGPLTDEEFELARMHPELGGQIIEHPDLADVRRWVEMHHERPDGRGYPFGLSGDEIDLEAQILAVADSYEAMTSDRVYRRSIGHQRARMELERCAGTQFDARVVSAFFRALERRKPKPGARPRVAAHA